MALISFLLRIELLIGVWMGGIIVSAAMLSRENMQYRRHGQVVGKALCLSGPLPDDIAHLDICHANFLKITNFLIKKSDT